MKIRFACVSVACALSALLLEPHHLPSADAAAPAIVAEIGSNFCFGDAGCPCSNSGSGAAGCSNLYQVGATLRAYGSTSVSDDDMTFTCYHGHNLALLFANTFTTPTPVVMGDGLRCVATPFRRLGLRTTSPTADWGPGMGALGLWTAGDTWFFQVAYRNYESHCAHPKGLNTSNAVAITFTP